MKAGQFTATVMVAASMITSAIASDDAAEQINDDSGLEIVIVTGVRIHDELFLESSNVSHNGLDNSDLLRMFPGGNRNANGPLSRISQYRGLFGAQNNVLIDGLAYSADCPNWMDTPLSSIPQSQTESLTLYRGLGSVDIIKEGLGGGIEIRSRQGKFSDDEDGSFYGNAETGYGSNASSWGVAAFGGFHNDTNWLDISASADRGEDYEFDGGVVSATEYDRAQYRFGYGHRFSQAEFSLAAVINRTGNSGTPALPMDIRFIDSEQYSLNLETQAGPGSLIVQASTLSVDHVMDNFTLRPPPLNAMGKPNTRQSAPLGTTDTLNLSYELDWGPARLEFGLDGKWEDHSQDITDPTRNRFFITNFNDVERDRMGLFAQSIWATGNWDLEAGVRYNRLKMSAGEVSGDLAIMMSSPMSIQQERLDELAQAFNESNRNKTDNQWSGVFKASTDLGESTRVNLGLGRKVRSPSYQERYLWLPGAATSGLADGRTYIGDINLKPEKSIEVTVGIDWTGPRFSLTPEVYYRDVSDFIQGVPSTNMTANKFAIMMSGKPPLQYANVDAKLYGIDLGYEWKIAEHWLLRGNLGYVRGKRTDQTDNLYRIAPLSSLLELMFVHDRYFISAESVAAARQDKVAEYNDEQESAGWGILNLRAGIELNRIFNLGFGVENLFDKAYQDHLGGYNRVRDSDVPVGTRLYSMGRNYYFKLNASW